MNDTLIIVLLLASAAFAVFLWVRLPRLAVARSGKLVLLVALLVLPLALTPVGVSSTLHGSKQKDFCVSCHEMEVYDTSLHIDDPSYIPAFHFQNRLVPQDSACYTCHTDYTLYGDVKAKFNGLKHVWVHYLGDVPAAGEVALYSPYPNDNCLQCHRGARRFERKAAHTTEGITLELLYSNQKSCMSKGCHDKIHDIDNIGRADLWGKPAFPVPEDLKKRAAESPAADDPFAAEDPFAEPTPTAKDPFAEPAPDAKAPDAGAPDASAPSAPDASAPDANAPDGGAK